MRADRLLSLLLLLEARGRMTARALADELEVSVRTVYRDLDALGTAGIPVRTGSGPGGGCELADGFRTPLTGLAADEAAALLALGVPGALEDLGLGGLAATAHRKVAAALPSTLRADSTRRRFHVDAPAWFRAREEVPHLLALVGPVREDRRLRILYRPPQTPERWRTVEPLGLVTKAGLWYLVARSGPHVTVYRAARIAEVRALDERFDRPAEFDLARFWARWTADFEASRPRLPVTVRVGPDVFAALPEVLGDDARATVESAPAADAEGWRVLTLVFESEPAAVHALAGFGGGAEVLAPDGLRRRVVEHAEGTLLRYRR